MAAWPPFVLLELSLISAQDLKKPRAAARLHAYAVAWVDPSAKLRTLTDRRGGPNPSWNDKFLFRVPSPCLHPDSPVAARIEIYAARILRDSFLGSVHLLLGSLHLTAAAPSFAALGIRRPSGSFRGVLNVAAAVIPEHRAPAAAAAAPAVGLRDPPRWPPAAAAPLREKNREEAGAEEMKRETLEFDGNGDGGRWWAGASRKKIHLSPSDMDPQGKENR